MAALPSPWGPRHVVWTIHRWLGLASGAVVFVVALTGALYAFAPEITGLYLHRHAWVSPPPGVVQLTAAALVERAEAAAERAAGSLPAGTRRWLTLSAERERSAVYTVAPAGAAGWYEVHVDPYRGQVLLVRDMLWDPLGIILRAHQTLLLPPAVGRRIVGVAVLVFVASLLTGLFLWFPRHPADLRRSAALRQRLTIDWGGRFFRVNYDLHRVLGGYTLAVTFVLALTGLVWSFTWVDRAVYWIASGGETPRVRPGWRSDPSGLTGNPVVIDRALAAARQTFPAAARLEVALATEPADALSVCADLDPTTSYRRNCLWFDRHTGRRLGAEHYHDKNTGERLQAMNYDIHLGRIAGLPGRLAVCLASLVAASLPITGALIWWNRGGRGGGRGP
jgi:uncharacterized iron-regulated membrane protein